MWWNAGCHLQTAGGPFAAFFCPFPPSFWRRPVVAKMARPISIDEWLDLKFEHVSFTFGSSSFACLVQIIIFLALIRSDPAKMKRPWGECTLWRKPVSSTHALISGYLS
ncbi:hypothetical protein BDY21DRAFT_360671 [Lineolata rhizophorae]|uniref:Uncharacterized protein n=1 Tax=Lineolata rhizophorae TaxID=578093 RepID=A0A6A6PCA6_9PEZI|nr:hypothetical protein BDY21DRAFT_360671 [Lineolata rhizophorae]